MLKLLHAQNELLARNIPYFTPKEFCRIFHISHKKAKYFLETYTKKGLLIRLKQGIYALKHNMPNDETMANILYRPSYISFEYALAKYSIIPEMVYQITSATTKPTRIFTVGEKIFSYGKIKKEAFTGYQPIKNGQQIILMADAEKAVVDYLYFVSLGKKKLNERMRISHLDFKKIKNYALLYKRFSLLALIKQLFL